MNPTRREFLRFATGLSGLALTGGATRGRDDHATARHAAVRFLAAQQSPDGAWRSGQYAAFRDGDALTSVVLRAIEPGDEPFERGLRWLERLTDGLPTHEPWSILRYPLFTGSYAAQVLAKVGDARRAARWAAVVEQLRISADLGWPEHDLACGAWSDSPTPPHLPPGLSVPPDMLAPNVSATWLGLEAMNAGGETTTATVALPFLAGCQNFSATTPGAFDDGGFFFALGDPIRNKAGVAGHEANGTTRFRSYGSATCDGLLALLKCGGTVRDDRVFAACTWLRKQSHGLTHSGDWDRRRGRAKEALAYYHAQAFAEVLSHPIWTSVDAGWASRQKQLLATDLASCQHAAGSWVGGAPESCEDDPILATAFALRALATVSSR